MNSGDHKMTLFLISHIWLSYRYLSGPNEERIGLQGRNGAAVTDGKEFSSTIRS